MRIQNRWPACLALLLIGFWAGVLWAGDPQMQVPETRFDFGEAGEGETIRHDFKILNSGSETLQLIDVRPG